MHQLNPVIDAYGTKRWYLDDFLHRIDGPAVEYVSGDKLWYKHDQLHRLNGAAVEYADGKKWWCMNGIEYTESQFWLIAFVNSQVAV